jgi:hypothetical protein
VTTPATTTTAPATTFPARAAAEGGVSPAWRSSHGESAAHAPSTGTTQPSRRIRRVAAGDRRRDQDQADEGVAQRQDARSAGTR